MSTQENKIGPELSTTNKLSFADFLEQTEGKTPEEIYSLSVIPENILGKGSNGTVYTIPGIETYVLKVNNMFGNRINTSALQYEAIIDPFPNYNFGQTVGQLSDKIFILKKQRGIAAGVDRNLRRNHNDIEPAKQQYNEKISIIARFPQSSFDTLAETLDLLTKNNIRFDPSKSNNVLFDAETQTFGIVDLPTKPDTNPNPVNNNHTSWLLGMLLDTGFYYNNLEKHEQELVRNDVIEIVFKCIQAGKKYNFEFPEEKVLEFTRVVN